MWVLVMCLVNLLAVSNLWSHWLQWKGFSPTWTLSCKSSWFLFLNVFLQNWQTLGWLSSWISLWNLSDSEVLKVSVHSSHLWGLRALWVFSWVNKSNLLENLASHMSHWWGFPPRWTFSWTFMLARWENFFSQNPQLKSFFKGGFFLPFSFINLFWVSSLCSLLWCLIWCNFIPFLVKYFSQGAQYSVLFNLTFFTFTCFGFGSCSSSSLEGASALGSSGSLSSEELVKVILSWE